MAYHFTVKHFLNHFLAGWWNIYQVVGQEARAGITVLFQRGPKTSITPAEDALNSSHSSVLYGFRVLTGLFAAALNWIPTILLDARPNLQPTRVYVVFNFSLMLVCIIIAIFLTDYIYTPVVQTIAPYVNKSTSNLLVGSIRAMEISYSILGVSCLLWLIMRRHFLHTFLLYKCKVLTLPHKLQLRIAVQVFCIVFVLAFLSEPTFTLFIVIDDYNQPKYFPQMTKDQFKVFKFCLCAFLMYGSASISLCEKMIPIITCCLITYTGEYVELVLKKLKFRLGRNHPELYGSGWRRSSLVESNAELLEELDVDTLDFDWPSLNPDGHKEKTLFHSDKISLQISSRIFFYKNLLMNLIELRDMKSSYEKNFGIFHILVICLNGSLVAQWLIGGLIQVRQSRAQGSTSFYQLMKIPLVWRAAYSVIIFTITNLFMFTKCDHLSNKIKKLQNHLFKFNLDLLSMKPEAGSGNYQREFDLLWSLYDQVERVSEEINFKLMGNTYYNKKCLLMVYSRELSAVLLYMQVVDLTNT